MHSWMAKSMRMITGQTNSVGNNKVPEYTEKSKRMFKLKSHQGSVCKLCSIQWKIIIVYLIENIRYGRWGRVGIIRVIAIQSKFKLFVTQRSYTQLK